MQCSKIFFIISLIFFSLSDAQGAPRSRPRLCSIVTIPNGTVRFRHNYKILRITCAHGFTIQGSNIVACENGKWNAPIPVCANTLFLTICAEEGCKALEAPSNGFIISERFVTNLYCQAKYKIAGGRVTYCNGTSWDRPLGVCRETKNIQQLTCDFETDDLCGWSHDETHNFDWKRIMAANVFQELRTGPPHDHTTLTANAGHYMLMESFDQLPHSVSRLLSPIYSKNITRNSGCFKFYYYMYGATVGSLSVYVRPVSVDIDQMLQESRYQYFSLSRNQKNMWKEAMFTIEEMSEDFQIVVEATAGSNHLSDIAIDDVELMTYSECNADSTTVTQPSDYTEYAIYDIQSCESRCNEVNSTGYGIKNVDGKILKMCDCHSDCENFQTCCPNYHSICDFGNTESSTELISIATVVNRKENRKNGTKSFSTTPSFATQVTKSKTTSSQAVPTQKTVHHSTQTTKAITTTTTTSTIPITTKRTVTPTTVIAATTKNPTTPSTSTTTITNTPTPCTTNSDKGTITELLSTVYTTTRILIPNSTVENKLFRRKEKVIFWEVDHSSEKENMLSIWDKVTAAVAVLSLLVIFVVVFRLYGQIWKARLYPYRYSSEDNSETTTLTYNQANDIILQN